MILLKIILWFAAAISIWGFIEFLIPYIKITIKNIHINIQIKWKLWILSKRIKRMAKKHTGEIKEQLDALSENMNDLNTNQKFIDLDDE